jgi:hypothetical protein
MFNKKESLRRRINILVNTSRASSLTLSKDQIALINLVIEETNRKLKKTKPNDIPDNVYDLTV